MALLTISNGLLTATISTRGAELQSLKDSKGCERLWQRDPAYWTGSAPILFPMAGGLKDDCYTLDGVTYSMPKHGFVRTLEWQVEKAEQTEAVFLMTEKHPGFPFDYELRAIFSLEENSLSVTYSVTNKGDKTFWYGIGAHEAYATPGGLEKYTILFDEKETLANFTLEGNLINPNPVIMAEDTSSLPLKTEYFAVDALVFRTLKSRGVTLVNSLNSDKIRVEFPEHDVLMFWTKPGAEYICIEPWVNAPDLTTADGMIEHKPGCICLQAGATAQRQHKITVA